MNEQDRQAIEGLFTRLTEAERQAGPKDAEAEAFIRQQVERQPGAPYLMAQTIVMQNFALEQAQQRIAELEDEIESRPAANSGGFLGGIFGGGSPAQGPRSTSVPAAGQPPRDFPQAGGGMQPGGYPAGGPMQQPQQGGGFLAGAAQTAMGVAGGVLLANAVGSMFGGGAASAATPAPAADAAAAAPAEPAKEATPEPAAQPEPVSADDNDGGGFFDDMFGGGDDMDI